MTKLKENTDIEIEQGLLSQKRSWIIQRLGWVVFLAFLVAAGLGLVGGQGPLNSASATSGHVEVEYKPFAHRAAPTEMTFTLKGSPELYVERDFLANYEVQSVTPEPSDVKADRDMLVYVFNVEDGSEGIDVIFSLRPSDDVIGVLGGKAGHDRQHLLSINQFVYP